MSSKNNFLASSNSSTVTLALVFALLLNTFLAQSFVNTMPPPLHANKLESFLITMPLPILITTWVFITAPSVLK